MLPEVTEEVRSKAYTHTHTPMLSPIEQIASSSYRLKVESAMLGKITARQWPRSDEKGVSR